MSDYSPQILFCMECGCVRTFEELNRNRIPYKCRCPEKGRIDHRTTECKECGIRFPFQKLGGIPVYCPACKTKLGIKSKSKSNKKDIPIHSDPYISGHPNAIASAERGDCLYRTDCLDEYCTRLDTQFLPCLGCKKYKSRKDES